MHENHICDNPDSEFSHQLRQLYLWTGGKSISCKSQAILVAWTPPRVGYESHRGRILVSVISQTVLERETAEIGNEEYNEECFCKNSGGHCMMWETGYKASNDND